MKRLIISESKDAFFNMAVEEYLLKEREEDILLLWRNLSPTVVIGVNQNAYQELNVPLAKENDIYIVRRLTGGGAVFHDSGNINYSMIAKENNDFSNYESFCAPIIDALKRMGANAEFFGRNDILLNGKKISGNAQTLYRGRIMHHGTLLFKGNLSLLSKVLKPRDIKFVSKGIKSVSKRVTNIAPYLDREYSESEFMERILNCFSGNRADLSPIEIERINEIRDQKYLLDSWNLDYSPKGQVENEIKFPYGLVQVAFDIDKGKVRNCNFFGDFFSKEDSSILGHLLDGVNYDKENVSLKLEEIEVGKYISKCEKEDVIMLMFGEKNE